MVDIVSDFRNPLSTRECLNSFQLWKATPLILIDLHIITFNYCRGSFPNCKVKRFIYFFLFSIYHLPCPDQETMMHLSHESRLINCLLDRYARVTTLARPVKDSSSNVVVEFGVSLIQILDFDEIKQIVTTSMWKNYVSIYL